MRLDLIKTEHEKQSPILIVVIVLLLLAVVLCSGVVVLWFTGRNAMTRSEATPEFRPLGEASAVAPSEAAASTVDRDCVYYNGKYYEYNQDIINILLLGIDTKEQPGSEIIQPAQADVVVLAVLDKRQGKMSLISLSRDIMCDIELLNASGEVVGQTSSQLALSYAYGDGEHISCEITSGAVSNLFYGLPIHGYGCYQFSGIEALNDAVGGVTLTVMAGDVDFPSMSKWLSRLVEGATLTLNGYEARCYINARTHDTPEANESRMKRQKQYMLALFAQAKEMIISNPSALLTLYNAVDEYVITDLNLSEISYLATTALSMDFVPDIYGLDGDVVLNEKTNYAEMYVDQESLSKLMIELFYTEVVF